MGTNVKHSLCVFAAGSLPFFTLFLPAHSQVASEAPIIMLEPVVVRGEKLSRTQDEVAPSILIIEEEEIDRPGNDTVISTIRTRGNVVAEEGVQLPAIRGIDGSGGQQQAISAGTQPRVPILIDDVARPLSNASAISRSSVWDVGSIEVARGPQPSSTGRNAIGGAIRIYTKDPIFAFEGAVRGEAFTEDGTLSGAGMLNLPLIEDQVALRVTAEGSRGDSFVDVTDPTDFSFDPELEESQRYRGKLLLAPRAVDGLSVLLSADYIRNKGPLRGFIDTSPSEARVEDFATNNYEENDQVTYLGRVDYQLSEKFDVVARTSFLDNDYFAPKVIEGVGAFRQEKSETEFEVYGRFSDVGPIEKGVFGFIRNVETESSGNDDPDNRFATDGEIVNNGLYGELEIDLGQLLLPDNLFLIAGGRYEIDDRTRRVDVSGDEISNQALTENRFIPKVGLRYEPSPQLILGYTYTEGFRPGGIDVDLFGVRQDSPFIQFSEFGPETIKQHELFVLGTLFNDRLNVGATAFYYKYIDAQVAGASPIVGSFGTVLTGNLPKAVGRGIEVDARFDIGAGFSATGSFGYLDTEITDAGLTLAQFEGSELPRAPNLTASLGLAYADARGFVGRVDARFVGDQVSELGGAPVDSYAVLDVSAGYVLSTENVDLEFNAYVRNITDNRYFTFRSNVDTPFPQNAMGRPRTFGVGLTARF